MRFFKKSPKPPVPTQRVTTIDFWRGVALIMIFINHMPYNPLTRFTTRAWGFSDAAEMFVFLSGVTAALTIGRKFNTLGMARGVVYCAERAWRLFRAHILLVLGLSAVIAVAGTFTDSTSIKMQFNFMPLFFETDQAIVKLVRFAYMPNMTDILPLYVLLLIFFPLIWFLRTSAVALLVALSGGLWFIAAAYGIAPDSYGGTTVWHFNPFAWQFLFVLGILLADQREKVLNALHHRAWAWLAAGILVVGALTAAPWIVTSKLEFTRFMPHWLQQLDNKTNLSGLRLLHFFASAFLVIRAWPILQKYIPRQLFDALVTVGQNSLFCFCLGTLLSLSLYITYKLLGWDNAGYVVLNLVGVVVLFTCAHWLKQIKELQKTPPKP